MSATILSLLVYALVLAPLALVLWRPAGTAAVATFYVVLIVAISVYQAGLLAPRESVPLPKSGGRGTLAQGDCVRVLDLLRRADVIVNRDDPNRPVVNPTLWSQLPPPVRDATVACLERARPEGSRDGPLVLVNSAGS